MNKKYASVYANHLGKILSNYSIVGLSLMILVVLSSFLSALYFILAFIISFIVVVVTFGLIFVSNPEFISNLFGKSEDIERILKIFANAFPYLFGITVATSLVSLILLCLNKEKRSTSKIVFSSLVLALTLIFGIIFLLGGVK